MKQTTIIRIEQEIVDEVYDVIDQNFSVSVGTRPGPHPFSEQQEVVLFSIEDFGIHLSSKEKKKLTKKLVKAFIAHAEETGDYYRIESSDKEQVILCKGALKLMFPKVGRPNKDDREAVENADKHLYSALSELSNMVYENNKISKIYVKIETLRDKLGDFI